MMAPQEDASPPNPHPAVRAMDHESMPPMPSETEENNNLSGSSSPNSEDYDEMDPDGQSEQAENPALMRPKLGSRKSSGTIIIPRDSPQVELRHEEYDEGDARTMSPRRSSEEIERMGQEARKALIEQAKALQASLLEICDRVETVRSEHEKLEGGNRFLQSYIGELMQTSKITAVGAGKGKGKARG